MERATSLSLSLGYGRTALLGGILRPPARVATTLHYPPTFHVRKYITMTRQCHDQRTVPIIIRADQDQRRRWEERASSVVLACVVGMMSLGLSGKARAMSAVNQALAVGPDAQSVRVPAPSTMGLDARSAVESLLEVSKFLSSAEESSWSRHVAYWKQKMTVADTTRGPDRKEVGEIKKKAMRLLKLEKSGEAEQLLKAEYNRWRDTGGPEVKFNMEMAIIELLLAQGKYQEASEYDCIKYGMQSGPSDPRLPLYKAIIYTATMDENKPTPKQVQKAKGAWDEFTKTLEMERPDFLTLPK